METPMKKLLVLLLCAALLFATAVAGAEQRTDVIYAPIDEMTHEKISETWDYPVLKDGTLGSGKRVGEEVSTEPHRFEDGVCIMCEYGIDGILYTDKALEYVSSGITSVDTKISYATGISAYGASGGAVGKDAGEVAEDAEALAAEDAGSAQAGSAGGPSAPRNRIAGQALKAVLEVLDPDDAVKLADIDRVLDADEAEQLARLTAREQVLVLLAAMGYDIDAALSDDARALLDAIRQRTTPEALRNAFPAGTVAVDGGEIDCFVMTLKVASAGGEVLERYAFRKDDGAFVQLTVEG